MTGLTGLVVRRAAASRGPLLGLAVLTALVVACVVGVLGQVEHGVQRSVRDAPELGGDGAHVALRTRLGSDPQGQDATVRGLVAAAVGAAHVDVTRVQTPDGQDTAFVTWTLTVGPESLQPDDVTHLASGLPGLEGAVKASDANVRGVVVSGGLVGAAASIADRATAFRQIAVVPILVLVVVGTAGLGRAARQVVAGRRHEDSLLAARGVGRAQTRTLAAAETGVVTVLGAAAGTGAGLGLLEILAGTADVPVPQAVAVAVGTAVVGTWTVTMLAGRQLDDLLRREPRGERAAGPVVLAVAFGSLAVLAAWRIIVAREAGAPDLLVFAAPGALLVALVLLGAQAVGPALALLARRAAHGRDLDRVLALRSAARRQGARLPAVVVGLAVGTLVVAAVYSGTAADAGVRRATLDAGADLRVTVAPSGPLLGPDVDVAPGISAGAAAAAPVVVRGGKVGAAAVTVLAAPAHAFDAVVRDAPVAPLLAGGDARPTDTLAPSSTTPILPGIIDAALAAALDVAAGGHVPVTVAGTTLDVRIVEVRDSLPGVGSRAVLLDADAVRAAQAAAGAVPMASEEVWLRTDATTVDAPAAARALATRLAEVGAWDAPAEAFSPVLAARGIDAVLTFWTAALASALLALAGLRATGVAQVAEREGETVALRALGMAPSRQGRLRARESSLVVGAGIVVGVVSGGLVAILATPLLVAGVATSSMPNGVPLALDRVPLLGGLAILVAGASVLVALHARTVARQAANLDLREVSA